jgi:exodeoxyribonuclease VII small subunit
MSSEKFEKSLDALETIVKRLESGELDLDASLKEFEEGVRLSRHCEKRLQEAEKRVEMLLKKNGEFFTQPLSPNLVAEESSSKLSEKE